ncbi:MAG: NADH:flavin oxidoreductase/NADH oxidase [Terriglobales bacterium]
MIDASSESSLFTPFQTGNVRLRNRIVVSPMCEYSSTDGFANDWHLVHLGSRAVGGAALVFTEATAVEARGRISPQDLGIWQDAHVPVLRRITDFLHTQGAAAGIQLAHAGRKASTAAPWQGGGPVAASAGGWEPVSPSAIPFRPADLVPRELSSTDIASVVTAFAAAAERATGAGFDVVELHAAHGYLLHEFLSPLSNQRSDAYGGAFENRIRIVLEVVDAVRRVWPAPRPLWVRISASDWVEGGWTIDDSVALARELRAHQVDAVDCSSGGNTPRASIPVGPGYQVPFAERIRKDAQIATAAVGMITDPAQANAIITGGQADLVVMAREMLRQPYWPLHAARALGASAALPTMLPPQYERAFPA